MKRIDDVTYHDVGVLDDVECPECGKGADLWEDPHGWGYQCHNVQCLSMDVLEGR